MLEMTEDDRQEQIECLEQELNTAWAWVTDTASEVDDYLAESRYDQVKEATEALAALVTSTQVTDAVDLAALHAATERNGTSGGEAPPIPVLAVEDLPAIADDAEDDVVDARTDSLRERDRLSADHIRRLFDVAADLLSDLRSAADAGDTDRVRHLLDRLAELPKELKSAYEIWERCLVDLYNENPGNLGYVGDVVASTETWLATRATT